MTDGLLQRFSTLGVGGSSNGNSVTSTISSSSSSSSSTVMPTLATIGNRINQRTHHDLPPPALLPNGKYPVYGPGTGPEAYDEVMGDYGWNHPDTVTGPGAAGGFFPAFLPWAQPAHGPQAHPLPAPPAPFPPYPVYRAPTYGSAYGKGLRFKGASVAVLTLLAFLFFLSILQNYIRDYSTPLPAAASQPTVIVLSSGATKDNGGGATQLYPYRRQHNSHSHDVPQTDTEPEEPDDDDDRDDGLGPVLGGYRVRRQKGIGHSQPPSTPSTGSLGQATTTQRKRQQDAERSGLVATDHTMATQPYGDIFKLNGLML